MHLQIVTATLKVLLMVNILRCATVLQRSIGESR